MGKGLYSELKASAGFPAWLWDCLCKKRHLEPHLGGKGQVVALFGLCSESRAGAHWYLPTGLPKREAAAGSTATAAPPQIFLQPQQLHKRTAHFCFPLSCQLGWRPGGSGRSAWAPVCPCGFPLFLTGSSPSLLPPLHIHLSLLPACCAEPRLQHLEQRQKPHEHGLLKQTPQLCTLWSLL